MKNFKAFLVFGLCLISALPAFAEKYYKEGPIINNYRLYVLMRGEVFFRGIRGEAISFPRDIQLNSSTRSRILYEDRGNYNQVCVVKIKAANVESVKLEANQQYRVFSTIVDDWNDHRIYPYFEGVAGEVKIILENGAMIHCLEESIQQGSIALGGMINRFPIWIGAYAPFRVH